MRTRLLFEYDQLTFEPPVSRHIRSSEAEDEGSSFFLAPATGVLFSGRHVCRASLEPHMISPSFFSFPPPSSKGMNCENLYLWQIMVSPILIFVNIFFIAFLQLCKHEGGHRQCGFATRLRCAILGTEVFFYMMKRIISWFQKPKSAYEERDASCASL